MFADHTICLMTVTICCIWKNDYQKLATRRDKRQSSRGRFGRSSNAKTDRNSKMWPTNRPSIGQTNHYSKIWSCVSMTKNWHTSAWLKNLIRLCSMSYQNMISTAQFNTIWTSNKLLIPSYMGKKLIYNVVVEKIKGGGLPKCPKDLFHRCPCPPARDLGSRVSGLVILLLSFCTFFQGPGDKRTKDPHRYEYKEAYWYEWVVAVRLDHQMVM